MEDQKFINLDEMMIEYSEMTSFDFNSSNFLLHKNISEQKDYTFKYGNYDVLDMLKSMFKKPANQEN